MNSTASPIETLFEKVEEYGKTSAELVRLIAIDKSTDFVSTFMSQMVIAIVAAMLMMVATAGVAIWLGELLGKLYYGFFAVSAFYALVVLLLIIFRDAWIKHPISSILIKRMVDSK